MVEIAVLSILCSISEGFLRPTLLELCWSVGNFDR